VLAAAGLIALAPVLILIAIAIKIDSPGPVFFRQRRYGQNNRIFRIFKFRTMTVTEDGPVVVQATREDARVTRIGRFLRGSSLDEIPQLINVLLGDMSIVGPRPHALAHDEDFDSRLDLFSRRRRVRPGITGWAQVNGFRGETRTLESIEGRMQHDLYYIDNWSIWLDLEIVARTILVFSRKAY
jgi:putative colanic acid biosynthesis UDP-glucose lipid carrier transferase